MNSQKIRCKNCNELNNTKRDYCWMCGKKLNYTNEDKNEKSTIENSNIRSGLKRDGGKNIIGNLTNIVIAIILFFVCLSLCISLLILLFTNDIYIVNYIFGESITFIALILILYFYNPKKEEKVAKSFFRCKYIYGSLNFLPNMICTLDLHDNGLILKNSGTIYNLKYEQINTISLVTTKDTERVYSSKGNPFEKTLTGSFLFGNVGAIAGAAKANQITSHIETIYDELIAISYITKNQENEIIYLKLDDNKYKFKKRLKYISDNYITNNMTNIVEEL